MDWYQELDKWIEAYLPDLEVRAEEPMARHTSFRIGGPARCRRSSWCCCMNLPGNAGRGL